MVDCNLNKPKNRFVCPNDRQLALRAKLKTGWSVKTDSPAGYQGSNTPLEPNEQEAIIEVIKRAEQLDHLEQERVGRLVERLENLRKNALGRNPSQCLLCGDSFGMLGAQKVVCIDCRKNVCQKCAIDNCSTRKQRSNNQWLCMICAESREIWKKSGAWFFKTLPKYILPGEKGDGNTSSKNPRKTHRYSKSIREEDSSSDEDKKPWPKPDRRNSSTESSHDVEYATLTQFDASIQPCCTTCIEPFENYPSFSDLGIWEDGANLSVSRADSYSMDASDNSRRESVASKSTNYDWNFGEHKYEDKISPGASSTTSSVFKKCSELAFSNPPEELKPIDTSMGIIEVKLTYHISSSTLVCTVLRAKNLISMDINGLADPFCKINILPATNMTSRLRTKTVHKSRNPEFNENVTFYEITENDMMKKTLHILVVDDDKYGHDYMGETKIELARLTVQNPIMLTLPLQKLRSEQKGPLPSPEYNKWFDDLWSRGQILLSLQYNTRRRALLVTVLRCVNLLPMDNNGFSDPFVKLSLRPDPCHRRYKTSIKWKNLNPVFNEEFAFETRPTELATQSLYITVWDKDYGKSNDYLGGLILGGVGSKGQRLKHWLDMIKYPNHSHQYWHNLTEDLID